MVSFAVWTDEDCIKLINWIKSSPVLYNADENDYGERGHRFLAWKKLLEAFAGEWGLLLQYRRSDGDSNAKYISAQLIASHDFRWT